MPGCNVRRGRTFDIALAAIVLFVQVCGTTAASRHLHGATGMDVFAYLLLVAGPISLLWRRRFVLPVLAIVFATTLTYRLIDYPSGPIWLGLIIAFCTVVQHGPRWAPWVTICCGYLGLLWGPALIGREPYPDLAAAIGVAAWVLVLTAGAEVFRQRRARRIETAHARDSETQRRVTEERLRIARELHDVLAHNISLINVQAGVALHLLDTQPEQGRVALQTIKDASKETLQELRSVLGVLRSVDEGQPRAPAPSLSRLPELVERSTSTGMRVRTEVAGIAQALPAAVDLAGYRIVQEALTNVRKHAGPANVRIALTYGSNELSILVQDDGTGGAQSMASGGNGIAGMRERATSLGGRLQAGPRAGGGFEVQAILPWDPEQLDDDAPDGPPLGGDS